MCHEKIIRRLAGSVVLLSVILGFTASDRFFWLAAFAAFNLLQSSFTGFCLPEKIFARLGWFGCRPRR
ncbi:MAG TPA: YgaP-like transmembrane domain [Gemmatimonas sp.]|uniref:YgaP-like transmembrane domain n=1 Tax=Gemmatimonas sp. TaxID=1962908 RepID=UPI002EDA3810